MKKFIFLLILTISLFSNAYAKMPNTMPDELAIAKARLSFNIIGADGKNYNLYIIGENEELVDQNWIWRQHGKYEEIWRGKYYAYLDKPGDSYAQLQSVDLNMWHSHQIDSLRINVYYPNRDGFYIVKSKMNQPDILISTIRDTGGGAFTARAFVVKNGKLQLLRFMSKEQRLNSSHLIGFKMINYLDDGTLSVPWWTNAMPNAGEYVTVYMLDIDNLILISSYTNKIPKSSS